jgi:hypothetical protein
MLRLRREVLLRWRCDRQEQQAKPADSVGRVRTYGRKSSRLSVPAATAPVGVVLLLGGVVEVCRHRPAPALVW